MKLVELIDPPDALEVEAGARGELMVARIRFWVLLLLAPMPVLNAIELRQRENWVGAGLIAAALLVAALMLRATRRGPTRSWLSLASTAIDVTLITGGLAAFLWLSEPMRTSNSLVVFNAYYIAIMATALRHDPRLSLLAGALAVVEYGLLVGIAATEFGLLEPAAFSARYGSFSWGTQISRMILLIAASALATIIILRQGDLLHRSSVDSLTSLYNRAAFTERLETEATRSRRHRHPLSLAMIDIDHFKHINDDHGHAAGDEALAQFAESLRTEFRTTDLVARYGGEEFVVMMPETKPDAATAKLERFVEYVAERTFGLSRRGTELRMTVSAGVAGVPGDLDDPMKLLAAADERLLDAKRAGRNRVVGVVAGEPGVG